MDIEIKRFFNFIQWWGLFSVGLGIQLFHCDLFDFEWILGSLTNFNQVFQLFPNTDIFSSELRIQSLQKRSWKNQNPFSYGTVN